MPTVAVDGVGAVALPVPPAGTIYHIRFVPIAVNGTAVAPWQYVTGDVTVGAAGGAVTTTVVLPEQAVEPDVAVTVYT